MTLGYLFPTVRDTWRALAEMPRGDNTLAGVGPAARESPATTSRDPAGTAGTKHRHMAKTSYIHLRDFHLINHYKNRNPPWVKLYRDIFSTPEFVSLSVTDRLTYLGLLAVAPDCDNNIPNDAGWISRRLLMPKGSRINLAALLESRLVTATDRPEPVSKSAPAPTKDTRPPVGAGGALAKMGAWTWDDMKGHYGEHRNGNGFKPGAPPVPAMSIAALKDIGGWHAVASALANPDQYDAAMRSQYEEKLIEQLKGR